MMKRDTCLRWLLRLGLSLLLTSFVIVGGGAPLAAQTGGSYDLTWNKIAGGGATFSAGGSYELGSTVGQADASALNGGDYLLFGGFWYNNLPTAFYTIAGTVSGLTGSGLVLQNNGGNDLAITTSGPFTFDTALANGSAYSVTVKTQPTNPTQTCTVANGTGTLTGANVTGVIVTCSADTYSVGGTVSGLTSSGLVLQNNGGDDLAIAGNGSFTFATALADGSPYSVTVQTQPNNPTQTCTVTNGTGTVAGANVNSVAVACVGDRYRIFAPLIRQ